MTNNNNRIYTKDVWEKHIEMYMRDLLLRQRKQKIEKIQSSFRPLHHR